MADSNLALVGAAGIAYTAPVGTPAPLALAPLSPDWSDFGYLGDDGLTAAREDDRQVWRLWGSVGGVRTRVSRSTKTFSVVAWETNQIVLGLYYAQTAAAVTPDPTTRIIGFPDSDRPPVDRRSYVFDILDGANRFVRRYIPEGEITARGAVTYQADEIVGYPVTITALPGVDTTSVYHWMLLDEHGDSDGQLSDSSYPATTLYPALTLYPASA